MYSANVVILMCKHDFQFATVSTSSSQHWSRLNTVLAVLESTLSTLCLSHKIKNRGQRGNHDGFEGLGGCGGDG